MSRFRPSASAYAAGPAALLYGILATLTFQARPNNLLSTMTVCFIFFLPCAIGAITVAFAPMRYKTSWKYGILVPIIPCTLLGIIAAFLAWEAWVCVVMALPVFWVMAGGTGAIFVWLFRRNHITEDKQNTLIGAILVLPFLLTPAEGLLPQPDAFRTVETTVEINAPPAAVWQKITTVPQIQPAEWRFTAFQALGLPMPVAATLDHEGVGGVRHATYTGGFAVLEPITAWEPNRHFSFEVHVDPQATIPAPLGAVGGKYFDVRQVGFTLEALSGGRTLLRLSSIHRVSTHFNFYAGLWTDFLMQDFQRYILGVLQARAEA